MVICVNNRWPEERETCPPRNIVNIRRKNIKGKGGNVKYQHFLLSHNVFKRLLIRSSFSWGGGVKVVKYVWWSRQIMVEKAVGTSIGAQQFFPLFQQRFLSYQGQALTYERKPVLSSANRWASATPS